MNEMKRKLLDRIPSEGECALIESAKYKSYFGIKPILSLQVNVLKSAEIQGSTIKLSFSEGRGKNNGTTNPKYGLLDGMTFRFIDEVMMEPAAVREYAKQKIIKNELFLTEISENKENIKVGQKFLALDRKINGFEIKMASVSEVSLGSVRYTGFIYLQDSEVFGSEEIEKMLDAIEEYSRYLLDTNSKISEVNNSSCEYARFVVSLIESNGGVQVLKRKSMDSNYTNIEMVKRSLELEYSLLQCDYVSAVIMDTYLNEFGTWGKVYTFAGM